MYCLLSQGRHARRKLNYLMFKWNTKRRGLSAAIGKKKSAQSLPWLLRTVNLIPLVKSATFTLLIKHFIVQLMHTNYKILRLLKNLKL